MIIASYRPDARCRISRSIVLLILLMLLWQSPPVSAADALGGARLFFSAAQRAAIDAGRPADTGSLAASPPRSVRVAVETPGPVTPAATRTTLPGASAGRRIEYSGRLGSRRSEVFLINGVPWYPGAFGIRSIRTVDEAAAIELHFDSGRSVVLQPGQSHVRHAGS